MVQPLSGRANKRAALGSGRRAGQEQIQGLRAALEEWRVWSSSLERAVSTVLGLDMEVHAQCGNASALVFRVDRQWGKQGSVWGWGFLGQGVKGQRRGQARTSKVANNDVGPKHGKENSRVTAQGMGCLRTRGAGRILGGPHGGGMP